MLGEKQRKPLPPMEGYHPPHPLVEQILGLPFSVLRRRQGEVEDLATPELDTKEPVEED